MPELRKVAGFADSDFVSLRYRDESYVASLLKEAVATVSACLQLNVDELPSRRYQFA